MVSRSDLTVSFLLAFAFWMVGRLVGRVTGTGYPLFGLTQLDAVGFVIVGLIALFLSALFLGRTVFAAFFILGLLVAPALTVSTLFLNVLAGLCWALFGVLGAGLGKTVAEEMQGDTRFDVLKRGALMLFALALLLSFFIGTYHDTVNAYNARTTSVLTDLREGRVDIVTGITRLVEAASAPQPA